MARHGAHPPSNFQQRAYHLRTAISALQTHLTARPGCYASRARRFNSVASSFSSSPKPTLAGGAILNPLPPWKRVVDIGLCFAALPVLALLTFAVAIVMSVLSPGPIFFRQERVGFLGRKFRLFKFRTMRVGAATTRHEAHLANLMHSNAPMEKLDAKRDARLIPGGWLIRATGLDELPQIINVLRGEMSIVGPRPCIPYEFAIYSPVQRKRFRSAPGLTGLWQVSGKNRTSFGRMIQLDIYYSAKKTLWLDLWIIARTLPAIVKQVMETRAARKQTEVA